MSNKKALGTKEVIELIAEAALEKQAHDIKVLDIAKTSSIVDYIIICSGESEPQLRAIEKEIDSRLRKLNVKGFRWQGVAKSGWIVLDLGDMMVHIMGQQEREYYNLEELWEKDAIIYHY